MRPAAGEYDRRLAITQRVGRGDDLIYRVVGESSVWVWSENSGALEVCRARAG